MRLLICNKTGFVFFFWRSSFLLFQQRIDPYNPTTASPGTVTMLSSMNTAFGNSGRKKIRFQILTYNFELQLVVERFTQVWPSLRAFKDRMMTVRLTTRRVVLTAIMLTFGGHVRIVFCFIFKKKIMIIITFATFRHLFDPRSVWRSDKQSYARVLRSESTNDNHKGYNKNKCDCIKDNNFNSKQHNSDASFFSDFKYTHNSDDTCFFYNNKNCYTIIADCLCGNNS